MRTTFFAINFSAALLLIASSIAAIGSSETEVGGLCSLPLATLFAGAELLTWYRRHRDLERVLGVICLGIAGVVLLAVVAGIWESMRAQWHEDFGWFLLILSCVGVYLGLCGFSRWRAKP